MISAVDDIAASAEDLCQVLNVLSDILFDADRVKPDGTRNAAIDQAETLARFAASWARLLSDRIDEVLVMNRKDLGASHRAVTQ
jgi:hypothetical protein